MSKPPFDAKAIFLAALEVAPEKREEYLSEVCKKNEPLRERVEALLNAHRDDSFLVDPPVQMEVTLDREIENSEELVFDSGEPSLPPPSPVPDACGTNIGPYKLLQKLGEGGMGTVYMAEQAEPIRRKVALKIIKPGMDSRQVVARFEAERQALALMDHPNIARVNDAGTNDAGRPYFVMELVKGIPITKYCDEQRLNPRERIELMIPVCQAIQHAHQKGIIHRDIKPSNVLVALYDGQPVPKVIDFGIAKATGQTLTEKTMFTEVGQIVGTVEYMSPEQAEVNQLDIDTRSDVYALGVMLYELLTGSTPLTAKQLREAGFMEMLRQIRESEPPKPSTRLSDSGDRLASISAVRGTATDRLSKIVRGELDWIVMKALEKDRGRRYDSAGGLADDIQRFLIGDEVTACPPSAAYRARKFIRRNKVAFVTSGLIALTLVLATIVSIGQAFRARSAEMEASEKAEAEMKARNEAEMARNSAAALKDLAQSRAYAANSLLIQNHWEQSNMARFSELLTEQKPEKDQTDRRGFEWNYWTNMAKRGYKELTGHDDGLMDLAYSQDGTQLVVAEEDEIWIWDLLTQTKKLIGRHEKRIRDIALSPDDKLLAAGIGHSYMEGDVIIWDLQSSKKHVLKHFPNVVNSVEFSPDGKYLAASTQSFEKAAMRSPDEPCDLVVWEIGSDGPGEIVFQQTLAKGAYYHQKFAPDSQRLAVTLTDQELGMATQIWDIPKQKLMKTFTGDPTSFFWMPVFSPDGNRLAVSSGPWNGPGIINIWDLNKDKELPMQLRGHSARVVGVDFNHDGSRLVSCSFDRTIKLWDVKNAEEVFSLIGHGNIVSDVMYSPNKRQIASVSDDQTARLWNAESGQQSLTFSTGESVESVSFGSQGQIVAAGDQSGMISVWDRQSGRLLYQLENEIKAPVFCIAFSSDDQLLAAGLGPPGLDPDQMPEKSILVWDLKTRQIVKRFEGPEKKLVTSVAFSKDGLYLASSSGHFSDPAAAGKIRLWNLEKSEEAPLPAKGTDGYLSKVAFSPDGKYLAWGWMELPKGSQVPVGRITVWDVAMSKEVHVFDLQTAAGLCVAFSADGQQIAAGCNDQMIYIWDMSSGQQTAVLSGHKLRVHSIDFSPNGSRLVSSGQDQTVKLWELATNQEVLTIKEHKGFVWTVDYSPDGEYIVSGSSSGEVKIWDGS